MENKADKRERDQETDGELLYRNIVVFCLFFYIDSPRKEPFPEIYEEPSSGC